MEEQSEEHHRCAQWSSIFNYIFRLIYDRYQDVLVLCITYSAYYNVT